MRNCFLTRTSIIVRPPSTGKHPGDEKGFLPEIARRLEQHPQQCRHVEQRLLDEVCSASGPMLLSNRTGPGMTALTRIAGLRSPVPLPLFASMFVSIPCSTSKPQITVRPSQCPIANVHDRTTMRLTSHHQACRTAEQGRAHQFTRHCSSNLASSSSSQSRRLPCGR